MKINGKITKFGAGNALNAVATSLTAAVAPIVDAFAFVKDFVREAELANPSMTVLHLTNEYDVDNRVGIVAPADANGRTTSRTALETIVTAGMDAALPIARIRFTLQPDENQHYQTRGEFEANVLGTIWPATFLKELAAPKVLRVFDAEVPNSEVGGNAVEADTAKRTYTALSLAKAIQTAREDARFAAYDSAIVIDEEARTVTAYVWGTGDLNIGFNEFFTAAKSGAGTNWAEFKVRSPQAPSATPDAAYEFVN